MTDWTDWAGRIALDAAKGAADGSIVPGFGTAAGALIGVATDMVPELAKAIAGDKTGAIAGQVMSTMQAAVTDPATLQDGEKLTDLKIQLAQIVSDRDAAANDALVERVKTAAADVANARATTVKLAEDGSTIAWGAPVVSAIVLVTFGGVMFFALYRTVPATAEPVLNVLLGTLGAMATSVVSYWVGSSAGSARKDRRLESMQSHSSQPSVIVPLAVAKTK